MWKVLATAEASRELTGRRAFRQQSGTAASSLRAPRNVPPPSYLYLSSLPPRGSSPRGNNEGGDWNLSERVRPKFYQFYGAEQQSARAPCTAPVPGARCTACTAHAADAAAPHSLR